MYFQTDISTRLDELLAYSIAQIPTLDYPDTATFEACYTSIVQSCRSRVSGYFEHDRSNFRKPLDDLGLYLYNETWQRNAKWEKEYDQGFRNDFPESYHDLRKLFYSFEWFMNLTNEEFFEAWTYASPTQENEDGTTTVLPPEPASNSYLSQIAAALILTTAVDDLTGKVTESIFDTELKRVNALADWLESSMGQSGCVMLWEDTGALVDAPQTRPIAVQIFVDKGLRSAIYALNLPVYIPTYLRESDADRFYGTFPSVFAMKADIKSVPSGHYVVISSNDEDNGNLYLKREEEYHYITNICGEKGEKGEKGDCGATFKPKVIPETCTLVWENDGGLPNPSPVCIKGDKGDAGTIDNLGEFALTNSELMQILK